MVSDEIGLTIKNDCDFGNVSKSCNEAIKATRKIVSEYVDNYDVILDVCYPAIAEQEIRLKKMVTFVFGLLCSANDIFYN